MSSSALPPLGNLPSWSRVSTLDRSRYPKPFLRDRLQTLPTPGGKLIPSVDHIGEAGQTPAPMDIQFLENLSTVEQQRLVYYNKSVKFLQQQHADTLKKLHEEIESLKQENKDLHFKFVMGKNASSSQSARETTNAEHRSHVNDSVGDIQSILLQEEIKDLRVALKNAHGRSSLLQHALQVQNRRRKSSPAKDSSVASTTNESIFSPDSTEAEASRRSSLLREPSYLSVDSGERPLPFGAKLNPLRVQNSPDVEPRPPSMEECEVIIKYLHRLSARQSEENQLLKSDLKDFLYSSKMNKSAKLRFEAKHEEAMKLPKVSLKQNLPLNNSAQSASSTSEKVSLPALKHSINTNIADRRKRQQAVQKARVKRESSHHV